MNRINYKSDFDFLLHLKGCDGEPLPLPEYNWEARLFTSSRQQVYTASCVDGVYTNSFNDNGTIHIVCDNHGLQAGTLKVEFDVDIPNAIYPDGFEKVVSPKILDIELVRGEASCGADINIDFMVPYIKGDKGDSAYQQAVGGGYMGTESEFIQQLSTIGDKQDKLQSSTDIEVNGNTLSVTDEAKRALFIDMWNEAWTIYGLLDYSSSFHPSKHIMGKYAPEEAPDQAKPFKAYDLWLTYEEAVQVMDEYKWSKGQTSLKSYLTAGRAKCAVPIAFGISEKIDLSDFICYNNNIEEICFYIGVNYIYGYNISSMSRAFHGPNNNIRKIHGVIAVTKSCSFSGCFTATKLESFHLYGLAATLDLGDCPLLTLDTFQYLIKNCANSKAITITVHPEVYAKLTDEGNMEWHSLIEKAQLKNITFVTR